MTSKERKGQNDGASAAFLTAARLLIAISLAPLLFVLWAAVNVPYVYGSSPDEPDAHVPTALNCSQCHTIALEFHDKLGSGNESCLVCHDDLNPVSLHLVNETEIALLDSSQLCEQCHKRRYDAWKEGTHGIPSADKGECTDCHDPHQPQVALLDITIPHPPATSPPPTSPTVPLPLFAIGLSVTMAGVVVVIWKR